MSRRRRCSHRPHGDPGTHRTGQRGYPHRGRAVRARRRHSGRPALYRAALLVLSDPAIARRGPAAGWPATWKRSNSSSAHLRARRPTAGHITGWRNCIRHAADSYRRARKAEADLAKTWIGRPQIVRHFESLKSTGSEPVRVRSHEPPHKVRLSRPRRRTACRRHPGAACSVWSESPSPPAWMTTARPLTSASSRFV